MLSAIKKLVRRRNKKGYVSDVEGAGKGQVDQSCVKNEDEPTRIDRKLSELSHIDKSADVRLAKRHSSDTCMLSASHSMSFDESTSNIERRNGRARRRSSITKFNLDVDQLPNDL